MQRLWAVFIARNKEFIRDKSTLGWNLLFPFLLLFSFYFVFGQSQPMFKVGVLSDEDAYVARPQFMSLNHVQFIPYESYELAESRLERHQIDLLIDIDDSRYWVNDESRNGYVAERLLVANDPYFQRNLVRGEAIRYVDWVLPGIIGMNVMFSSLFGVGYVIVRYRKNGVLKRLSATPLTAVEFISAQLMSRMLMVLAVGLILFFGAQWLLGTLMVGQLWLLVFTLFLGTLALVSLALVIASRLRSEEFTGGLLNMATWPMMGLSEVWFPLEGAPFFVIQFSQLLPLTHLVQAMREIMLDGAGIIEISDHLLVLTMMSAIFLALGSLLFNWRSDSR